MTTVNANSLVLLLFSFSFVCDAFQVCSFTSKHLTTPPLPVSFVPSISSPLPKRLAPLLQCETKLLSSPTDTEIETETENSSSRNIIKYDKGGDAERSVDENVNVTSKKQCWDPQIRKMFTVLSVIGMVETGYLSYIKLFDPNGMANICGGGEGGEGLSSCSSVLNSPYASLSLSDEVTIPLTLIGFLAYTAVAVLSAGPLLLSKANGTQSQQNDVDADVDVDVNNRVAILCTTTSMATFSSFLLSLLYTTLHQWCPYCILSAGLSLTMGLTAWTSNILPNVNRISRERGAKLGLGSFVTTTAASLLFFFTVDQSAITAYQNDVMAANGLANSNNIVATAKEVEKNIPPPPITSTSSDRALKIGQDMKELNTRFFGAYWCSHCYDQKQRLGKEAMANVEYIECSKEGLNSQNALCKERGVPGYPTWEIGGKLYPGEMYLDELEEIIAKAKGG